MDSAKFQGLWNLQDFPLARLDAARENRRRVRSMPRPALGTVLNVW